MKRKIKFLQCRSPVTISDFISVLFFLKAIEFYFWFSLSRLSCAQLIKEDATADK